MATVRTKAAPPRALSPVLDAALAAGVAVVTPNKRLARRLIAAFDDSQRAAGRIVWPAARVQPWSAWLQSLWLDVVGADALSSPPRLSTPGQSAYMWDRIVATETARSTPLVDSRGAAKLAADAWRLVNAWGAGGTSWRGWTPASTDDDTGAFVRWAERYTAALAHNTAIDTAQLADVLAQCAPRVPGWRRLVVALAGFIETSPQHDRLVAALSGCGAMITHCDTLANEPSHGRRTSAATARDELALALTWARTQVIATPGATVAIALDDLSTRRAEVIALAEDVLCPQLQWPGCEDAPRPYNVSLGKSLDELPIVAAAIGLIALAHGPLPVERAAALIRSPYIAGAGAQWMARAALERVWIERGQREIGLNDVIGALASFDHALAQRWRMANGANRLPAVASPRAWIDAWQTRLAALGWPGERSLRSAEYQARGAWDEALAQFAALHAVESRLTQGEALQTLRALAADTLFQPEVAEAPIQILGSLEAAGQRFDALWVAALLAERWPAAAQPNPLLPVRWQRERNVPHSSAARELAYARTLTAQLMRAAPTVVLSHAHTADGHPLAASSLIDELPKLDDAAIVVDASTAHAILAAAPARERLDDTAAPMLMAGSRAPGGAGLIEKQSDCPFRAVASYRLQAEAWPELSEGLTPIERGDLVHRALAAFWRDLHDQRALLVLTPDVLQARIESAVAAAMSSDAVSAARWRRLPAVVVAGEARRMTDLIRSAVDRLDRTRPPFIVRDIEWPTTVTLSGLTFHVCLDRVDGLPDGGVAIIDYKTGRATSARAWFSRRPQAPQLGLYAVAMGGSVPSVPVRAVAYVQLKPGEQKALGLAADATAWPGLGEPSALRGAGLADWSAAETRWRITLGALADEIAAGHAAVAPRDPKITCRNCGLQPLCRIGAWLADVGRDDGDV
jgi:probable DNA repair protein